MKLDPNKPPNTLVVTYSELDSFRQCPLKHQWSYVDKYREDAKEGSALTRGSLWHRVMECHYLLLRAQGKQLEKLPDSGHGVLKQFMLQHLLTDSTGEQTEDMSLIEWMYEGYLECYGLDPDWETVLVESAGEVPLGGGVYLRFKIDLVARQKSTNTLWLWDHKSKRAFSRDMEIALDDQFILYTWALRKLGVPIHGIVRSDARTQRNKGDMGLDQRFQRVTTYCSDLEADNVAADALLTAQAAYMPGRPVYPSPTPDRCNWRCPYTEPCIARRKGLGTVEQLMGDFGLTQVQEKHREYAADPVATLIESGELRLETEETA